jgi:hypothetical protein
MTKYVCFLILGDKYVNGEIIPCKYPTFQPKRSGGGSKSEGRRYERRRDGPISAGRQKPRQEAAASDSSSTWGSQFHSLFHSGCYWSSLSCSVKQYLYEVSNIHGLFPVKGEWGFFPNRNQSFLGDISSFALILIKLHIDFLFYFCSSLQVISSFVESNFKTKRIAAPYWGVIMLI